MIRKNRLFERIPPSREAKSIYIFAEGVRREADYFNYFKEIDSRINIEIYPLNCTENNSPKGLYSIAEECFKPTNEGSAPKYDFKEGDEVWLVLDIDMDAFHSREPQIEEIADKCRSKNNWFLARSNPCFEVWLYYHFFSNKPEMDNPHLSANWKSYLNNNIPGGFDSRKHPIHIETARKNAENNFSLTEEKLDIACTEVFKLANSIIPLIKEKLKRAKL